MTLTFDLWPWPFAWTSLWSLVITPENFMMIRWWERCQKGVTDRRTDRQTEIAILKAAWSQLKTNCNIAKNEISWFSWQSCCHNCWLLTHQDEDKLSADIMLWCHDLFKAWWLNDKPLIISGLNFWYYWNLLMTCYPNIARCSPLQTNWKLVSWPFILIFEISLNFAPTPLLWL